MRAKFTPGLPAIVVFEDVSTGVVGNFMRRLRAHIGASTASPQTLEVSDAITW